MKILEVRTAIGEGVHRQEVVTQPPIVIENTTEVVKKKLTKDMEQVNITEVEVKKTVEKKVFAKATLTKTDIKEEEEEEEEIIQTTTVEKTIKENEETDISVET